MSICKCSVGLRNTGFSCSSIGGIAVGSFMFNRFKEDGSINEIDLSTELVNGKLPVQAIIDRVNDTNPADRWYPIGLYENVEDIRAEFVAQTFNSGNSVKIKNGIRSFSGLLTKKAPSYVRSLESFGCNAVAVIYFDEYGNLIGESIEADKLRGISIDQNTISAVFGKTTDTEGSAILHSYNFSRTVDDANLSMIGADNIDGDVTAIKGLLDVNITSEVQATSTEVTVQVLADYGMDLTDKTPVKSLLLADFDVHNVTQSASVTLDSATLIDADKGAYKLAYSSGVASSDVITITASKVGYEFNTLSETVS